MSQRIRGGSGKSSNPSPGLFESFAASAGRKRTYRLCDPEEDLGGVPEVRKVKRRRTGRCASDADDSGSEEGIEGNNRELDFRSGSTSAATNWNSELVRFSNRRPGILGARLLRKMEHGIFGEEGPTHVEAPSSTVRPVARAYIQRVMTQQYPSMSVRNKRVLMTWATGLDLLAKGQVSGVAALLGQRIKAIEQSMSDAGSWHRAQYAELIPQESSETVSDHEAWGMTREASSRRTMSMKADPNYRGWVAPNRGGGYQDRDRDGPKKEKREEEAGRPGKGDKGRGKGRGRWNAGK